MLKASFQQNLQLSTNYCFITNFVNVFYHAYNKMLTKLFMYDILCTKIIKQSVEYITET